MKTLGLFLLLAFTMLTFTSCERRPLVYDYYPYADLTIEIDWTRAFPDAEDKPTGVSVWFYPQDGGEPTQTYSSNVDSHKAAVRAGTYDVVVFNLTPYELSSTIGFRGEESLSTLEVFSKPITSSRAPSNTRGTLTQEPEAFATTVYRDLEVTEAMVEETKYVRAGEPLPPDFVVTNRVVEVTPERANHRHGVRVRIKGFHNLANNGTFAELSGLAEGFLIDKGRANTVNARQQLYGWTQKRYDGEYSVGEATVEFTTWGLYSDDTFTASDYDYWLGLIELMFMLVDKDETIVDFTFNLDRDNLREDDTLAEVILEIVIEVGFPDDEDITLPDVEPAGGEGSGFKPEVNPWDEEDVPIVIG